MRPGYLLFISCTAVFVYFFVLYLINFLTHLNYRIHGYTPPEVPMYYQDCPPPPPEYYLRLEYLESQPENVDVPQPSKGYHPNGH